MKRYRDKNRMSVTELAGKLECSRQFVYALEDGTLGKVPGLLLAERIQDVTGIPAAAWDRIASVRHHRPIRNRKAS